MYMCMRKEGEEGGGREGKGGGGGGGEGSTHVHVYDIGQACLVSNKNTNLVPISYNIAISYFTMHVTSYIPICQLLHSLSVFMTFTHGMYIQVYTRTCMHTVFSLRVAHKAVVVVPLCRFLQRKQGD